MKFQLLCACLAYASQGRRVQPVSRPHGDQMSLARRHRLLETRESAKDSLRSLAETLLAAKPATSFSVPSVTAAHSPSSRTDAARMQMETVAPAVAAADCASCEQKFFDESKDAEVSEQERRETLRLENMTGYMEEIYNFAMQLNDTMRAQLALETDTNLRKSMLSWSTAPTPLLEKVYNNTMQRVPYELACFICAPEQAGLLRTAVALSQPRRLLDVGCFTGHSSAAILEALPANAKVTALDIEPQWTEFAGELLKDRNVEFITGPANESMAAMEKEGRLFDFVTLDADKPMHAEYINQTLRLLRPGGLLVMFGLLLFPTVEDQEAMEALHTVLPNMTDVSNAQLPIGCGVQLMVKREGTSKDDQPRYWSWPISAEGSEKDRKPLEGDAALKEQKRWQLESEIAAINRYVDSIGTDTSGVAGIGPGAEPLSTQGLLAMGRTPADQSVVAGNSGSQ